MKAFNNLCEHFSDMNVDWHLCGGFAIDAYLGDITRKHINIIKDNIFYYKRNRNIILHTDTAFIKKDGISIIAPEIVLLYKSTNYNNSDYQHDFDVVINKLEKEIYEETGLAVDEIYYINIVFITKIFKGAIRMDGNESKDVKFIDIDKLPKEITSANIPGLRDLMKKIDMYF